ncbi:DUF3703 domain-containing protein [Streptomyces sp. NPDC003038]
MAGAGSFTGRVPQGDAGRARVGPFTRVPVPDDPRAVLGAA